MQRPQKGNILIITVILVLALTLLGLSLQWFLRSQIRNHYGLLQDGTGSYNLPLDDAYMQGEYMAEFGINWTIWMANSNATNPNTGGFLMPPAGWSGPSATPIPTPSPNPTLTPGYADPAEQTFPEPSISPYPATTPTPVNYIKNFFVEIPAANQMRSTGRAFVRGNTTSAVGTTKTVTRQVHATWALAVLPIVPPANLITWYKGENNGNDEQVLNHGTVNNALGFAAGYDNQGFNFANSANNLTRTGFVSFPTTEISVAMWLNTSHANSGQYMMNYVAGAASNELAIYDADDLTVRIKNVTINAASTLNVKNAWTHIAFTWRSADGQSVIYVNGIPQSVTTAATGQILTGGGCLVLGQDATNATCTTFTGGNSRFVGGMDDVTIYNRVLNPTEIQSLIADQFYFMRHSTWSEEQ